MKITNKKIKKLIQESIQRILFEDYKGVIGGELKKDPNTEEWISDRHEDESGIPIVFDSDEQNTLAANFTNPAITAQIASDQELKKNIGPIPNAPTEKQKKIAGRMFSGKSFKTTASWMWGKNAFPESNVYLIPIAGGAQEAAKLIFGYNPGYNRKDYVYNKSDNNRQFYKSTGRDKGLKDMSSDDIYIYKHTIVDFETRRNLLFDIEAEGINILTNLGVNIGEISSMDLENDIIFIPLVTGTARNFMSSPHMIIHALFDTTGEKGGTDIDNIINPLQDEFVELIRKIGFARSFEPLTDNENLKKLREPLRTIGTTYAFRNNLVFTPNDMVSEMLTQEITNQRPKDIDPSDITHPKGASLVISKLKLFPKESQQELLGFINIIKESAQKIRELLKGKIIIINVV